MRTSTSTTSPEASGRVWLLVLLGMAALILLATSCAPSRAASPTPTPDYPVLETRIAYALGATLTAKAPTATLTPQPTNTLTRTPTARPTPTLTPTPGPSPLSSGPLLAYVHAPQDQAANVILRDTVHGQEEILTHFVEPRNMIDTGWTKDGQWIVFVSAHDFIHSRNNERNVFIMRPDGTGLRMITGEYVDPESAPGPYVTLKGQVEGAQGKCIICAQGATSPTETNESGAFELQSVPVTAQWVRAVCQNGETALQGDTGLQLSENNVPPVTISVAAQGQGWTQAALSRDLSLLTGMFYQWTINAEGKRQLQTKGILQNEEGKWIGELELPAGATLNGVDWSPVADEVVGALTGEKGAWLWRWDQTGKGLGALVEMPNPNDTIYSALSPVWSGDGSRVAFSLRHWYWWGENKYKTELMVVDANGQNLRPLVTSEWGFDALYPSWSADGTTVYFQLSNGSPADPSLTKNTGSLWSVPVVEGKPSPLIDDGISYFPAARPPTPAPTPRVSPSATASPTVVMTDQR